MAFPGVDPYSLELEVPKAYDVSRIKIDVQAKYWQFMVDSGGVKPAGDSVLYLFAVAPKDAPRPDQIVVSVKGIRDSTGSEVVTQFKVESSIGVRGAGRAFPKCVARYFAVRHGTAGSRRVS